ncbi:hypothetical protein HQ487_00955 [Candidatus Uhrbacteria bacterium]|nr:hypothetical protein [Candidatus Uhrbacteria bacterium]
MNPKMAWEVLFSKQAPSKTDFDEAVDALDGVDEVDPAIVLEPEILKRADEYLTKPPRFITSHAGDVRVAYWKQHAESIGESFEESAPVDAETNESTSTGLSASALINASGDTDSGPSLDGFAVAPRSEEGSNREDRGRRTKQDRKPPTDERGREREPPPPPKLLFIPSRDIPAVTQKILVDSFYQGYRVWFIEAYVTVRNGTPAEKVTKTGELADTREYLNHQRENPERTMIVAHLMRLIEALEEQKDVTKSEWFQANYVTGTYT